MQLDRSRPFGTVSGHRVARFEQDGTLFNIRGEPIDAPRARPAPDDMIIETDAVDSARLFLLNILSGGPLSKSVIYKVAEENNQKWPDVSKAADLLKIVKFTYNKATMWKLPEEVGAL